MMYWQISWYQTVMATIAMKACAFLLPESERPRLPFAKLATASTAGMLHL
jgi:hypothetical protein